MAALAQLRAQLQHLPEQHEHDDDRRHFIAATAFSALLAGTVQAAVLGAGAARRDHLPSEGLPGPEQADTGGRGRQACCLRERFDRRVVEVHGPQGLGIFGLEGLGQPPDARADFAPHVRGRHALAGEVTGECRQPPSLGAVTAVPVDRRIAEHAVEPRDQSLIRHRREPTEVAGKGVLQEILGELAIADAPLEVAEKRLVVLNENLRGPVAGPIGLPLHIDARSHASV